MPQVLHAGFSEQMFVPSNWNCQEKQSFSQAVSFHSAASQVDIEEISNRSPHSFNHAMTCTSPLFTGPSTLQFTYFLHDQSYLVVLATQNQCSSQLPPPQITPLPQPCNTFFEVPTLVPSLFPINSNMDAISNFSSHTTTILNPLAVNTIELSLNTTSIPKPKRKYEICQGPKIALVSDLDSVQSGNKKKINTF